MEPRSSWEVIRSSRRSSFKQLSELDKRLMVGALINDGDACSAAILDGANPNCCKADLVGPVHIAAEQGFLGVLRAVLAAAAEVGVAVELNTPTLIGLSPLALAVEYNRLAVLEELVASGAELNALSTFSRTALHVAALLGRQNACLKLIDAGADVNAVDCFDKTPLSLALSSPDMERTVKRLLEAGANPNFRHKPSVPLLWIAALGVGRLELPALTALLKAGADVTATDSVKGDTALHRAAMTGYVPAIKLLIFHGADLLSENYLGETPLNIAIKFLNIPAAEYLALLEEEREEADLRRLGLPYHTH